MMGVIASSAVARLGYERFWSDFGSNGGRLERTPNLQSNAVNVGLEKMLCKHGETHVREGEA